MARRNHHLYVGGGPAGRDLVAPWPRPGRNGCHNRDRAGLYGLAEYYLWSARRGFLPTGNDPRHGGRWNDARGSLGRRIGRAENLASARVCYDAARELRCPLP